jgi:hypothetical protein
MLLNLFVSTIRMEFLSITAQELFFLKRKKTAVYACKAGGFQCKHEQGWHSERSASQLKQEGGAGYAKNIRTHKTTLISKYKKE